MKKKEYLETLTEEEKIERNIQRKPKLIKKLKHDAIIKVVGFATAVFITFTFIFGITSVSTNDMYPATHEGDTVLYFRLGDYMNGDVVIYECGGESNIGRVQGSPGQTIGMTNGGKLTIDGNFQPKQEESGLFFETYVDSSTPLKNTPQIGSEEFLVLGDKRNTATDSRTYGLISKEQIKGKVFTVMRRRPL